jgi:hypothetical protein
MTTCKACNAPLIWIKTTGGKNMPCNVKPVPVVPKATAKELFVTKSGSTFHGVQVENHCPDTAVGYIPHWSTCPAASSFKKRKGSRRASADIPERCSRCKSGFVTNETLNRERLCKKCQAEVLAEETDQLTLRQ